MRAIVLSGGGSKGAYQIGVWKALKKLNINYDIVCGTSVGALNGCLFVQNDYTKAVRLWKNINFNLVFDENELDKFNNAKTTKDLLSMFGTNFFKNGGMDVTNLENLISEVFDEKKFFNSKIDYGASTYNLTDLKGYKFRKRDFNDIKILDYIISSGTCYPAFKMKKIGDKNFIDGGIFDNLPINSAIDMGATEIIAINVHGPGIIERVKNKKIPIITIEPKNDIGWFLNFNKKDAQRGMRFGYLDGMKAFNKLDGIKFSFKKGTFEKISRLYSHIIIETMNYIFDFAENKTTIEELLTLAAYKRVSSLKKKNYENQIFNSLEYLMEIFEMNEEEIYSLWSLNIKLMILINKYKSISKESVDKISIKKKLTNYNNKKGIIKYFYLAMDECYKDNSKKKALCRLSLLYPKEFLASLYLYSVKRKPLVW